MTNMENIYRDEVRELRIQYHNLITELAALVTASARTAESTEVPSQCILDICRKYLDIDAKICTTYSRMINGETTNITTNSGYSQR